MSSRPILQPGPDHPITIEPADTRVVVSLAGRVIADTENAVILREADYPPVVYVPLKDVEVSLLQESDHSSYCPYKGECSYYSVPIGGEASVNAVWRYKEPYEAVAQIRDRVAFYPDRVDSIEQAERQASQ